MTVDINLVFTSVATLLIVMLVGTAGRLSGIINRETTKKLSGILVYITQPLMIIASLQIDYSPELLKTAGHVLLSSVIIHTCLIVIAFFAFRRLPLKERKIYNIATVFGNCGYMGFPILKAVFGDIGLFYGVFFTFVFNVFLFSYGIFIYTRGTDKTISIRKIIFNAGTVSSVIGFILFVCKLRLPAFIGGAFEMVGDVTFPLSMLIIGSLVCDKGYKKFFTSFHTYYYLILRLLMLPVLTLLICLLFRISSEMTYLCVIMTAVPGATAVATFADLYGCDARLAAKLVGFSTVLSVLTIPLTVLLTGWVYNISGL